MPKLFLTAIDLSDEQFQKEPWISSVEAQVKKLIQLIKQTYDQAKQTNQGPIVVTWQEHGIVNFDGRILSEAQKTYCLTELLKFSDGLSDLVLIPGTIKSRRISSDPNELSQIINNYQLVLQKIPRLRHDKEFMENYNIVQGLKTNNDQQFSIVENLCCVIQNGKIIYQRKKMIPAAEGLSDKDIFDVGTELLRADHQLPFLTLTNGEKVYLCIEICVENFWGIAKKFFEMYSKTVNLIQLVLSDYCYIETINLIAAGLHADSKNGVSFFGSNKAALDIHAYKILAENPKLGLLKLISFEDQQSYLKYKAAVTDLLVNQPTLHQGILNKIQEIEQFGISCPGILFEKLRTHIKSEMINKDKGHLINQFSGIFISHNKKERHQLLSYLVKGELTEVMKIPIPANESFEIKLPAH